jgi:hypothetical protein
MSVQPGAARRPRLDLPLRLLFHRYLREEVWALRRRGDAVVAVEPDEAVLDLTGLNMMSGRRIDQVEQSAYQLACRRQLGRVGRIAGTGSAGLRADELREQGQLAVPPPLHEQRGRVVL